MRIDRDRLRLLGVAMAAIAVIATTAGCGEGEQPADAQTPAAAQAPKGKGTPESTVRRLMDTIATASTKKECRPANRINARSPQKFLCPPITGRIRDFEIVDSATFGTGAVIDYTTRKTPDGASMVLFLAPDSRWAISRFGMVVDGSASDDDDESRAGFDAAVDQYVKAVRDRDCDRYMDNVVVSTEGGKRATCKRVMKATRAIARGLEGPSAPRPRYLGGSDSFGFYSLRLREPEPAYMTISVVETVKGSLRPHVVLGVHAGPSGGET